MGRIYHIAYLADWKQAQDDGEYRMSTRGRTLEQQGFIHAGAAAQVAPVANVIYLGEAGLLVLVIDESKIESEIVYESVPGWDDPFPHIYGPLNVDAVVETLPFESGPDGGFSFTAEE
jgi:glutathione S-transferase